MALINNAHEPEPQLRSPGRLERTVLRWLLRPSRVTAVETIAPQFRLIELEGEALRNVEWSAGHKIQVSIGAGMTARTFTPMNWNFEEGRTRLLVYTHAPSPAKAWSDNLRPGDSCQFFGPRASTSPEGMESPVLIFGDETAFALAAAMHAAHACPPTCVFEVTDLAAPRAVLERLGVPAARLFVRRPGDDHFPEIEALLRTQAAKGATFLLTGKASSIQRLGRALKADGVSATRLKSKAYWAPGKSGLD